MKTVVKKLIYTCLLGTTLLTACKIENDIPYPIVDGSIQNIEMEGQCDADGNSGGQASINKNNRTISLYVDDSVDITKLRITKLNVTNDAQVSVPPEACNNYEKFPHTGFDSLEDIPISSDTRMDFSAPVAFTLQTYQEYTWQVNVTQIIKREVTLENQVGKAIIDDINRNVVIYVAKEQPLDKIKVSAFHLGGMQGTVVPDPTAVEYYDFSEPCSFFVSHAWEAISHQWTVYVYHTTNNGPAIANVFPMTNRATLSGEIQQGKQPEIEYKKTTDNNWDKLSTSAITIVGTTYTATLNQLSPNTTYQCKVSVDGTTGNTQTFTTAPATPLTDAGLDNWYQDGKLWNPWEATGDSFWDTGNRGATTVGDSNSVPTDDTCNGSGKAALLESKYIVLKFAAGNLFTGSYLKTTGTNGVLSFGRPFTSFPSKLRVNYKYTTATIDKTDNEHEYLKGRPDSCHVYIALTDWDEPLEIRTRPSERQLFDKNDPHVIAYAELIKGENVASYQQVDLPLNYRYNNRTPKYILVVASASKYGDFFTGGVGSKLWVDNFELIYD